MNKYSDLFEHYLQGKDSVRVSVVGGYAAGDEFQKNDSSRTFRKGIIALRNDDFNGGTTFVFPGSVKGGIHGYRIVSSGTIVITRGYTRGDGSSTYLVTLFPDNDREMQSDEMTRFKQVSGRMLDMVHGLEKEQVVSMF